MVYTDEGFIIKKNEMLNEDKVVQLYLKNSGKISCVAKGVKKITSRKSGSLDLLNLCKFSLAKGKNLDIMTEVKVINDFSSIKSQDKLMFILFYIDEIIAKMVYDGEESREIFDLLKECLDYLNTNTNSPIKKTVVYLNAKMLLFSGVYPEMYSCMICGEKIEVDDEKVATKNGIAHSGCFQAGRPVSNNMIKVLRFLKDASIQNFMMVKLGENLENELYSLTITMIEYTIGESIRSKLYLHG